MWLPSFTLPWLPLRASLSKPRAPPKCEVSLSSRYSDMPRFSPMVFFLVCVKHRQLKSVWKAFLVSETALQIYPRWRITAPVRKPPLLRETTGKAVSSPNSISLRFRVELAFLLYRRKDRPAQSCPIQDSSSGWGAEEGRNSRAGFFGLWGSKDDEIRTEKGRRLGVFRLEQRQQGQSVRSSGEA